MKFLKNSLPSIHPVQLVDDEPQTFQQYPSKLQYPSQRPKLFKAMWLGLDSIFDPHSRILHLSGHVSVKIVTEQCTECWNANIFEKINKFIKLVKLE